MGDAEKVSKADQSSRFAFHRGLIMRVLWVYGMNEMSLTEIYHQILFRLDQREMTQDAVRTYLSYLEDKGYVRARQLRLERIYTFELTMVRITATGVDLMEGRIVDEAVAI